MITFSKRAFFILLQLLPASTPWLLAACDREEDCSCFSPPGGLIIRARVGDVVGISASGQACSDARLRCVPNDFSGAFTPGCKEYQLLPERPGECHAEVQLADGRTLSTTVMMIDRGSGCCGGITAEDWDHAYFDVSPADAGAESGPDANPEDGATDGEVSE